MNCKPIKAASKALEAVMNCVPSVHSLGERVFVSTELHHFRARIDASDDALRIEQDRLTDALVTELDADKRAALLVELSEVRATRAKLEALDDELHAKDFSYKKTMNALFEKSHSLLTGACSTLDSLIEYLSGIFSKRRSKDVG
ncbi:MAG: hypothetical protein Q8J63_00660 [Candidatus Aquicultor sp.]|nr:hypothetical protein [Candidatus Aquicultor sp.]